MLYIPNQASNPYPYGPQRMKLCLQYNLGRIWTHREKQSLQNPIVS